MMPLFDGAFMLLTLHYAIAIDAAISYAIRCFHDVDFRRCRRHDAATPYAISLFSLMLMLRYAAICHYAYYSMLLRRLPPAAAAIS